MSAEQAGFSPDRIIFVGPSKTEQEISEAISKKIDCLVVETARSLQSRTGLPGSWQAGSRGLRIDPAFDAAGSKLEMGGSARQFGIDEEVVESAFRAAASLQNTDIIGCQVYLGTRILDHEVAWKNTKYVLELGRSLQDKMGCRCGS